MKNGPRARVPFMGSVGQPTVVAAMLVPLVVGLSLAGALVWLRGGERELFRDNLDVARGESLGAWLVLLLLAAVAALPIVFAVEHWIAPRRRSELEKNGTAERLRERYGIALDVAWPRLAALLSVDEAAEARRAGRAMRLARALSAGSVTAGVLVYFAAWLFEPSTLRVALLVVSVYTIAVGLALRVAAGGATQSYWAAVERSFDLHRFRLLESLRVPLPLTLEQEREVNARVASLLSGERRETVAYRHGDGGFGAAEMADIRAAVESTFSSPRLAQFTGSVGIDILARVADGGRSSVIKRLEDGSLAAVVEPAAEHDLVVELVPGGGSTLPVTKVISTEGDPQPTVRFHVDFDSDTAAVRFATDAAQLDVGLQAVRRTFLLVPHSYAGDGPLWITVGQSGFTIGDLIIQLRLGSAVRS